MQPAVGNAADGALFGGGVVFAAAGGFFVAELLCGTGDAPFAHGRIGADLGIGMAPAEDERERKTRNEKGDNPSGNQKHNQSGRHGSLSNSLAGLLQNPYKVINL